MSAVSPDCEMTIVSPPLDRRLAVAVFGGDVDLDREPCESLDPIFSDEARHIGRAAADDRDARQRPRIDRPGERPEPHGGHVDVVGERMADDFRLFVDLLGHEVPIVAFFREQASGRTALDAPLDRLAGWVADVGAFARERHPVAILEIGDAIGEWRERQRVGAEVHPVIAVADRERRAPPGPDQQISSPSNR